MSKKLSPLESCLAVVILLALVFGFNCLVVWVAQYALAGLFGYQLPFWPGVAALFILQLLVKMLRSK